MNGNLNEILEEMRKNQELHPEPPNKLKVLFKLLPFSNSFLNVIDKTALATSNLVAVSANSMQVAMNSLKSAKVLQGLSIGFAALDVIFVPITALLYFDKHDPVYFTLSNATKFAYSAAILSLLTLSVFFPPVAFVTAGLGLAGAGVSLVNHFYKAKRVPKQLQAATEEIEKLDKELAKIAEQAEELAKAPEPNQQKVEALHKQFKAKQHDKQEMLNYKQSLTIQNEKLNQKRGRFDKLFGLAVSAIALAGILTSIAFPAVGLLVLAGAGASAATYMAGRFIYEVTHRKSSKTSKLEQESHSPGSVVQINQIMKPENTLDALKHQQQEDKELNKKQEKAIEIINKIKKSESKDSMQAASIDLMCAIGKNIKEGKYEKKDIKAFLEEIPGFKEIQPSLKEVIDDIAKGNIKISDAQLADIKEITKVSEFLEKYSQKSEQMEKQTILSAVKYIVDPTTPEVKPQPKLPS